ncbi:hypothetical protein TBR22_A50880 [Luteitalea sp. TBR-22]|uniref:DUF2779 domain-containing protein n=1 Tax=Luteitalea sp. TBR-22 TaxID=2802971 RepID=UPI001AF05B5F|nr:DUF2779 domain-containing protein [Luteitalea sp. TBR-22]BCS35854.1 hypothetical protein TBR22_A50880 [Luteitalea sp. TBR-22]
MLPDDVLDWWEYHEGRRCVLAAWKHHRQRAEGERTSFDGYDQRERVRGLAQLRWPGGQDTWQAGPLEATIEQRTQQLIAQGVPAIFRAGFTAGGSSVSIDVLERRPDGSWTAVLLATRLHLDDFLIEQAALTLHVLRAASVAVAAIHLLHVDVHYARVPGPIDPFLFFGRRSLTIRAARALPRVVARLEQLQQLVAERRAPVVPKGTHCACCAFTAQCVDSLPADWTGHFPHEPGPSVDEWIANGWDRMGDVPDAEGLGPKRLRARQAALQGHMAVDPGLPEALKAFGPPAFYLDFESLVSLIPVFEGTRPAQHIPFLWSLHHVDTEGRLTHIDEIVPPGEDPRRRFAESLVEAVGSYWEPIIVYSDYESWRLQELAELFPDLAPALQRIRGRLVDLLELVRDHVYDLNFLGNYSLKAIGPVLAPGLTYKGLSIKDGLTASRAYASLIDAQVGEDDVAIALHDLRRYCERDTLALVDVHRTLMNLANGVTTTPEGAVSWPSVQG